MAIKRLDVWDDMEYEAITDEFEHVEIEPLVNCHNLQLIINKLNEIIDAVNKAEVHP